jgi:hypothetical protein
MFGGLFVALVYIIVMLFMDRQTLSIKSQSSMKSDFSSIIQPIVGNKDLVNSGKDKL